MTKTRWIDRLRCRIRHECVVRPETDWLSRWLRTRDRKVVIVAFVLTVLLVFFTSVILSSKPLLDVLTYMAPVFPLLAYLVIHAFRKLIDVVLTGIAMVIMLLFVIRLRCRLGRASRRV